MPGAIRSATSLRARHRRDSDGAKPPAIHAVARVTSRKGYGSTLPDNLLCCSSCGGAGSTMIWP
jgi:hypothetical protein